MKPIIEMIDGKQSRIFTSMQQLKECNLSYKYVHMCATGKKQSYKGKQYIYKDSTYNQIQCKNIDLINKYDKHGKLIKQYKTLSETTYDGHENRLVSRSLKAKGKIRHDGYIWIYDSDKDELNQALNIRPKNSKKVIMLDNGKIIHEFVSISEARRNGYYDNGIKYSINNNVPYLGYNWKII